MRADLLRAPLLGPFLRWKHARTALQAVMLMLAALVILDGLLGPSEAPRNAAGTLPWVHWRGLVVLALLVAGNLFCMACPFMLPRRLAKRFLPGDRVVPKALRTKWTAAALLLVFFWAYEAFDLWASPWLTAWVVVAYFALAFVVDGFFRGAAFCKHLCPIGQFNFVNSLVSPAEVAVRDPEVCAACPTKDCIRGRYEAPPSGTPTFVGREGQAPRARLSPPTGRESSGAEGARPDLARLVQNGCELWLYQPRKVGNMDCTFCLDCVQACPYDNVGILYRTPGRELWQDPERSGVGRFGERPDLAALAALLTFAAFVNASGMVAPFQTVGAWVESLPGLSAEWASVGATFLVGLVLLPLLLLAGASATTRWLSPARGSLVEISTRYVWSLVPLGFGMWLGHYLFHFLLGALGALALLAARIPELAPIVAGWPTGSLAPATWLLPLQLLTVEGGALASVLVAHRIARRDVGAGSAANRAFAPWAALSVTLSLVGMWLLTRPMEMRGTIQGLSGMGH